MKNKTGKIKCKICHIPDGVFLTEINSDEGKITAPMEWEGFTWIEIKPEEKDGK